MSTGLDAQDPQLMVPNPFAPPPPEKASPRLYSPGQIGAAAILGTFIAGVFMYAANQRRLGERRGAVASMVIGSVGMALLLLLAFVTPAKSRLVAQLTHVLGIALWQLARTAQTAAYQSYVAGGGKRASNWSVVGITLVTVIVVSAIGAAAYFVA
ncbi:MAG: hypothetical protein JWN44_6, partial [Myxococcales bacterium]|nr:hypothetical protein [Myxococcales bacterium]